VDCHYDLSSESSLKQNSVDKSPKKVDEGAAGSKMPRMSLLEHSLDLRSNTIEEHEEEN